MLNLKQIRSDKKLTLTKLSKLSGVSVGYLSELERDGYDPTVVIICKLCKALNCTPNNLIKEEYWS